MLNVDIVIIYGMSDLGRSHGFCGRLLQIRRRTDMPYRESMGMESLFSWYWEGIKVDRI